MLFRFLIMVHVCAAFPLKCPEPAQWSLRARSLCPDPSKYFCLRNDLINGYSENCTVFDFLQPGRKNVLRGGLDADVCSSDRYQPWPLTYYTNVSTNCIFLKATCNEEGQVVHDKGNRNTDITCKCDYTKGYDFLVKPRNPCFCIPSEEDCSCFLKTCPNSTFKLSPDYECIHLRMNITMSQCRSIMNGRENRDEKQSKKMYTSRKDNITESVLWKIYAWISTFVVCIIYFGLIFAVCTNGILDKYYHKAYLIRNPPASLTFVEGQTMFLTYKLLINRFVVVFKRNDDVIGEDSHNNEIEPGRSKTLTIQHITINDEGEYYLEALGLKCRRTMVTVKQMFKKTLTKVTIVEGSGAMFECETEEENSPVEWFKDGKTINDTSENIKMESLQGYIYKLTITSTSLQDTGTYTILKNGIRSEAVLEVKALFKRPLEKVTIVEGFDVQFECETEEDSSSVEWSKDYFPITPDKNNIKMETLPGHIYKLSISPASLQDSGIYRIEKNGIRSEAVLDVKALFKQPLTTETVMEGLNVQFECETEEDSSSVQWFKDDIPITFDTENLKMETLPGHIYKLIISPASLQDSGRYRIEKNGIRSEAVLDVKEMPETIKQMSDHDREAFLKATKSGTLKRYNVTVMIVGKGNVGKTCLLRRLMKEQIDDVKSTDGLDIVRKQCRINVKDGEWDLSTPDKDGYSQWSGKNEQFAYCGFWDFAGQKEFYATHQAFLSSSAVYLLVVDISKQFKEKTYNNMIEESYDCIGEYVEFWLDSIHCYSTDVDDGHIQYNTNKDLNPPVIIVGTGMDKVQSVEKEEKKQSFYDYLDETLSSSAKRRHLRNVHFLSNTLPSDTGEDFEKLRNDIFDEARTLKNWGDNLPTRWIVLEKEINRKISKKICTLSYKEAIKLATDCSFPDLKRTTFELDSFLKYEHDIGNIIFFEDVKDFIVIDPKWLVDVFKCFVSHKYKPELINMPEWSELVKNGKLLNNLIVKLLEKVPHLTVKKHKDFVLKVMEKFDIIVRPINDATTEVLYMPCMIRAVPIDNIIKDIGAEDWKKTSWFCLEFDFLPPSYFNHILACFVREMKLWTKKDSQLCIYRNIGFFDINEEFTKVLIVCLSKNSIGMQIRQWKGEDCYSKFKDKLIDLVRSMKLRYRMNVPFKKKFNCSNGVHFKTKGRVDYDTLLRTSEYNCLEDKKIHSSEEIYRSWITTSEIKEVMIDKPVDQKDVKGLIIEADKFDIRSEQLFTSLMKEEDYPSFESKVMLVGEQGTGKTTIARYLVGKLPTKFRKSTDGIELFNGLSYFDCETKEWLSGHLDFSLEEVTVSRCFVHVQEDKRKQKVSFPDTTPTSEDGSDGDQKLKTIESPSPGSPSSTESFMTACENVKTLSEQQDYPTEKEYTESSFDREVCEAPFKKYNLTEDSDDDCSKPVFVGDLHMETVTKPGQIRKLKNIFGVSNTVKEVKVSVTKELFFEKSLKVWNKQLHKKRIAPIIIWDFGGQDVFYSTHQTFLTHRAIYIIVLDGSRRLDDPCPYEQYLPGKSGHKTARDYLIYWINTIVTYCRGSLQGFPKIVIVLTHKDKVLATGVENKRHALFAEISKMFQQTPVMQHLVIDDKIFVNTKDANDPEMAMIKDVIIRESEKQPAWGEYLSKCFIPLELEFASLIKRNIPLITLEHLKKINSLQSVRPLSETELKVFLKFQHSIGKLLYFDKPKLDDRIILSPALLIDAFKSIVTEGRFCQGDKEREEVWDVMSKKGVVSKHAIQQMWKKKKFQKFYNDKDYLLDVMNYLDILVEPKRYDSDRTHIPADFYYVASMVRAEDDYGYLQSASFPYRSIAIAFQSSSLMIPPALSFRFLNYCMCVWAVKIDGNTNMDMLFHRSGVFTIDPSLDMYIGCEDKIIIARLVHATSNTLIMRNVASSIYECLTSALEKISKLYIRLSSEQTKTSDASFISRICCNSPDNPCFLQVNDLANTDQIWICPAHGIEHNIHTIASWIATEKDEEMCKPGCTVTKEEFLKATPSDLHLRRLSLLYSQSVVIDLAKYLGLSMREFEWVLEIEDPSISSFAILRKCRDYKGVTFKDIKEALEITGLSIHILCKLVMGQPIYFDMEPEKWDLVPTAEHIYRLAPLVGNNSLPLLIELGMDFDTWEQIRHRQIERDLVRLNQDILEEWKFKFCRMHYLKPTLRTIAQAFSNIGKSIKLIENVLSDLL